MNILRNKYKYEYIKKTCFFEGVCVEFERKNDTQFVLLSNYAQVINIFYDWPVKYNLWRFRYMNTKLSDRVQGSFQ